MWNVDMVRCGEIVAFFIEKEFYSNLYKEMLVNQDMAQL